MRGYCQTCGREVIGRRCACRSTSVAVNPPHFSTAYCRDCQAHTRWRRTLALNGAHPLVLHWACLQCESVRYQYSDVNNVRTMCVTIMEKNLRSTGANLDHDEALSRLETEAWRLYLNWDPGKGLNFQSFAFGILGRRAYDIYRDVLGRNGEKPDANAISFPSTTSDGWEERLHDQMGSPDLDIVDELRLAL